MSTHQPVKEYSAERQIKMRRFNSGNSVTNLDVLEALNGLHDEIVSLLAAQPEAPSAPAAPAAEAEAEAEAAAGDVPEFKESLDARIEIAQMVRLIGRAKLEIASIKHPMASEDDRMQAATNELDAIVLATETSTHDILTASEQIEHCIREISGLHPDDEAVTEQTDQVANEIINIFEACSFQDITGQRVTKVVKTLRFIEERILALINIWGIEAFADLPMPESPATGEHGEVLSGPQLGNQGITQDEINALFD